MVVEFPYFCYHTGIIFHKRIKKDNNVGSVRPIHLIAVHFSFRAILSAES